jgi:hypothetical protein
MLNAIAALSCPHASLKQPSVQTIAGTGAPGITDGAAHQATFVGPAAVAIGPDGSIYVADELGQSIRRIRNGKVVTVAGISTPGITVQERASGYLDGPAAKAKFDHPSGIAVARDGTIYIADSGNRVIRKISHGIVTTFTHFAFIYPRDIAIDGAGNLFVADAGGGIRRITPAGTVSTLTFTSDRDVCGVSVRGSGKNLILAYTDKTKIIIVHGSDIHQLTFDTEAEPQGEGKLLGFACRLAVYDQYTVAVSDARTNMLRFVRLRIDPPVGAGATVRALAGGNRFVGALGGDRDGTPAQATVDVPGGVAITRDNSVVFADTGNRKIRQVLNVDPRGPLYPGLAGLIGPTDHYRIAILGASYDFHNVFWSESMGAQIESGLSADGARYGLLRCPYVAAVRYSGLGIEDAANFLISYFGDGGAELVIYEIDFPVFERELLLHPELAKDNKWEKVLPEDIASAQRALARNGTKMLVVIVPPGRAVSPLERSAITSDTFPGEFAREKHFEDVLASSNVPTLKLLVPMESAEESPRRVPLFNVIDPHPSPDGQMWIGKAILDYLKAWKPWNNSP